MIRWDGKKDKMIISKKYEPEGLNSSIMTLITSLNKVMPNKAKVGSLWYRALMT